MKTLLISGVSGQVGVFLTKLAPEFKFNLVCGVDKNAFIDVNFPIYTSFNEVKHDVEVIVDFSSPELCDSAVDFARQHKIKLVCGTTNLKNSTLENIYDLSKSVAICLSSNFSRSIPPFVEALKILIKRLDGFDVSMTEIHNNKKVDCPSGTAKKICNELKIDNVNSIRGGNVAGVHTARFLGMGEEIEITHRAYDKSIFAKGALYCATQLLKKERGLFDNQMLPISHP